MTELFAQYPLLRLTILLGLFALVAAGVYFVMAAIAARQMSRRRLVDGDVGSHQVVGASLRSQDNESAWLKLVNGIEKAGLSLVDTRDDSLRKKLVAAGYTAPYAPRLYTLIRLVLVIGLPLLLFGLIWATAASPGIFQVYAVVVISALAGLYLPAVFLAAKADRRQQEIINGFPDALDLMLVCVEAGLGMDSAFARVGMEMTNSHPRLAEQFGAVVLELRAGRSHDDALRRMADRAGAEEIRAFATLLIQSIKAGFFDRADIARVCGRNARAAPDARRGEGASAAGSAFGAASRMHAAGDDRRAHASRRHSGHSNPDAGFRGRLI